MKLKQFFLCSLLIFASAFAFAEKSRFYEDGRLIDIMYVDATSGLRVRDKPDLSGNKICSLENAVIVKVVAIGKTECIDDKNDPWVEILIPAYMWKNKNVPEYGWVYGGYLVSKRPASKIPLLKGKALEDLLVRVSTWQTEGCQHFTFYKDGWYRYIDDGILVGIQLCRSIKKKPMKCDFCHTDESATLWRILRHPKDCCQFD